MHDTYPALQTDFYQITMAAAYFANRMNGEATFSLFSHDLPTVRGYLVAAGLEQALDILENFSFAPKEIDYLESLDRFSPEFLDYLAGLCFTGSVRALPEGSVFFAGEPVLEVTAPIIEAQLVETHLLNTLNINTTLASKAARCVKAARGRACVDFSLRRNQGLAAGYSVARSSALVGFAGTSNVAAAAKWDIPPVGTMAHAFVEAFGDEIQAFQAFADTFPDHTVLLVDTYDSEGGLVNAVEVAKRLTLAGHRMVGVRLDSGDLVRLSRRARQVLDEAGLEYARVVVSGSLDEHGIAELIAAGAQVDSFGVGTKMGCSADAPYCDLAYKLVSYQGRPTLKLSYGKETWASPKQLFRRLDEKGRIAEDVLALADENLEGRPLLKPVMENGRALDAVGGWREGRTLFSREYDTLPDDCRTLDAPRALKLKPSSALKDLQARTKERALANQRNLLSQD